MALSRFEGEKQARRRASNAEQAAVAERNLPELLHAHGLVEQANAMELAGAAAASRPLYREAAVALTRLGADSLPADLGLLESFNKCPPPLMELAGHGDAIHSAAFAPDGHHVLTASKDATLKYWDLRTGSSCTSSPATQDG